MSVFLFGEMVIDDLMMITDHSAIFKGTHQLCGIVSFYLVFIVV